MDVGIATLSDLPQDPPTTDDREYRASVERRLSLIIRQAEVAEAVGLDHIGVGEHHSFDFAVSSPAVVLAGIATRTKRLQLTSAVTVLSVHDPVRVIQDFATVDQLSGGRAEIAVGRSAFAEPFALFGYDLAEYDELFTERLELLLRLRSEQHVIWHGRHRPPLPGLPVTPPTRQESLPVWLGVGGSPQSAIRAGTLGLPMIIGHIGGSSERVAGMANLYRQVGDSAGHDDRLRVGIALHLLVTETEQEARQAYPHYREFLRPKRAGGSGFIVSPEAYAQGRRPGNALMIGTTEQITDKLRQLHDAVRFDRLQALTDWGGLPDQQIFDSISRFGQEVAPHLRNLEPSLENHLAEDQIRTA